MRRVDRTGERGYVAVVTSLLMIVLLMMVGMAVDVGYWYARSSQLQRAADAAALAGATLAPHQADEIAIATQTLERNSITAGPTIDIDIAPVADHPQQLRVSVRDRDVPSFFTRIFRGSADITRTATAEYIKDISLGSAFNAIGTGPMLGHVPSADPAAAQHFWLAISGYCTQKEDGDRISAAFDGGRRVASADVSCEPSDPWHPNPADAFVNTDYDPAGYPYVVHVPCPGTPADLPCPAGSVTAQPIYVEAFDPVFSPADPADVLDARIDRRTLANSTHWSWPWVWMSTTFRTYQVDATPDDVTDDVLVPGADAVFGTCLVACWGTNQWVQIAVIPAGSPAGDYRVQVHTGANEMTSFGTNQFALRARIDGAWAACTSIPGQPGHRNDCPSVSGRESMGVYANKAGSTSDMFLARLAPADTFRGKRVRILLWDPGEGGQSIQILPPGSATPANFSVRTWFPGLRRPADTDPIADKALGWSAPVVTDTLDVSGTTPLTGIHAGVTYPLWNLASRYSQYRFNDRMVAIEVAVPRDYGLDALGHPVALPDDGWWKIRYNSSSGTVQDRTTWTVALAGDPVHLVDAR